jgi:hypothetical protein
LTGRRDFTQPRRTNQIKKHAPAAPVQRIVMRVAVCDKPDILFDNRFAE